MVRKRDLIIAVLITFCLTATLFLVKSTRSQTPSQYDPWGDVTGPNNGPPDGLIDIRDISYVAKLFGTSGDPTRNVNVTNWPFDASGNLKVSYTRATADGIWSGTTTPENGAVLPVSTRGYDRISIFMESNGTVGTVLFTAVWVFSDFYFVANQSFYLNNWVLVNYPIQAGTLELHFVGQSMEDNYQINVAYYLTA